MPKQELNLTEILGSGNEVFIPNLETGDSVIPLLSLSLIAVNVLERLPLKTRKTVLTCGVAGALTAILALSGCQAKGEEISSTQLPERPALTVSVPQPAEQETPMVIFTPTAVFPEVTASPTITPTEPAAKFTEKPEEEIGDFNFDFEQGIQIWLYTQPNEEGKWVFISQDAQIDILEDNEGNFIEEGELVKASIAMAGSTGEFWLKKAEILAYLRAVEPTSEPAEPTQRPSTPIPGGETPIPSASPTPQGETPVPPASPTPGGVESTPIPTTPVEPSPIPPTLVPPTTTPET